MSKNEGTTRKVLVSNLFGSGWGVGASYGFSKKQELFARTYEPIVNYIEENGEILLWSDLDESLWDGFLEEWRSRWKKKPPSKPSDLKVVEVKGRFRVMEHDGAEYVELEDDLKNDWL